MVVNSTKWREGGMTPVSCNLSMDSPAGCVRASPSAWPNRLCPRDSDAHTHTQVGIYLLVSANSAHFQCTAASTVSMVCFCGSAEVHLSGPHGSGQNGTWL